MSKPWKHVSAVGAVLDGLPISQVSKLAPQIDCPVVVCKTTLGHFFICLLAPCRI